MFKLVKDNLGMIMVTGIRTKVADVTYHPMNFTKDFTNDECNQRYQNKRRQSKKTCVETELMLTGIIGFHRRQHTHQGSVTRLHIIQHHHQDNHNVQTHVQSRQNDKEALPGGNARAKAPHSSPSLHVVQ